MSDFTVKIKPNKTAVSSVLIGQKPNVALSDLQNVDASDPNDGEVLVYDGETQGYVVKAVEINSNNITNVRGGGF